MQDNNFNNIQDFADGFGADLVFKESTSIDEIINKKEDNTKPMHQCNRVTITGKVNPEWVEYKTDKNGNEYAVVPVSSFKYKDKETGESKYEKTYVSVFGDKVKTLKQQLDKSDNKQLTFEGYLDKKSKLVGLDNDKKGVYENMPQTLHVTNISNDPSKSHTNKAVISGRVQSIGQMYKTEGGQDYIFCNVTNAYSYKDKETGETKYNYQHNPAIIFGQQAAIVAELKEGQEVKLSGTYAYNGKQQCFCANRVTPGMTKEQRDQYFENLKTQNNSKEVSKDANQMER